MHSKVGVEATFKAIISTISKYHHLLSPADQDAIVLLV